MVDELPLILELYGMKSRKTLLSGRGCGRFSAFFSELLACCLQIVESATIGAKEYIFQVTVASSSEDRELTRELAALKVVARSGIVRDGPIVKSRTEAH